jgi:hypothetical protein
MTTAEKGAKAMAAAAAAIHILFMILTFLFVRKFGRWINPRVPTLTPHSPSSARLTRLPVVSAPAPCRCGRSGAARASIGRVQAAEHTGATITECRARAWVGPFGGGPSSDLTPCQRRAIGRFRRQKPRSGQAGQNLAKRATNSCRMPRSGLCPKPRPTGRTRYTVLQGSS